MKSEIAAILDELSTYNPSLRENSNPGLTRCEILAAFNDLPLKPTEELIDLYMWSNGSQWEMPAWLVPGYYLIPLEEGIESFWIIRRIVAQGGPVSFPVDCFAFTSDGAGGMYGLQCADGIQASGLIVYAFGEDLERVSAYSLEAELQVILECCKQEIFSWTDEDNQEEKYQAWQKVAESLGQPGAFGSVLYKPDAAYHYFRA